MSVSIAASSDVSTVRRTGAEHHTRSATVTPDLAPPSARESQLIMLIAQGFSNKVIAHEMSISPNTVRTHISNIMRRYKLRNRTQVAMLLMPCLRVAERG